MLQSHSQVGAFDRRLAYIFFQAVKREVRLKYLQLQSSGNLPGAKLIFLGGETGKNHD